MSHDDTTYERLLADNNIVGSVGLKLDEIDQAVRCHLDETVEKPSAIGYGESFWTRTYKLENGTKKYFLKIAEGDGGKNMMEGEYESQCALYEVNPSFVPKPLAWGTYVSDRNTHFFLSDFVEMTGDIPTAGKFCAKLATLHMKSMEQGSGGKGFGFDISTTQGSIPLNNDWDPSWESFFSKAMKHMMEAEEKTQGPSTEIQELKKPLLDIVIPRLLGPLEKTIKPCLVHGDLWHGNTSVSAENNEPYAFDSCVLWAHNEYEMGIWRAGRYKFGRPYLREYHRYVPVSQPEADWDDRNALYGIRVDLLCSALYGSNQRFRELAIDEMRRLVEKHKVWDSGSQLQTISQ